MRSLLKRLPALLLCGCTAQSYTESIDRDYLNQSEMQSPEVDSNKSIDRNFSNYCHEPDGKRLPLNGRLKEIQERTKNIIREAAAEAGASKNAVKLLYLVAARESSLIGPEAPGDGRGVVHRFCRDVKRRVDGKIVERHECPDMESSGQAWLNYSKGETYKDNPFFSNREIWLSYGLFGQNSPIWTKEWDKNADPRVMCDPVINSMTYLNVAKKTAEKLRGNLQCPMYDENGYVDAHGFKRSIYKKDQQGNYIRNSVKGDPTWINIHRAVSGGNICPPWEFDTFEKMRIEKFSSTARSWGLDPNAKVSPKEFGTPPVGDYTALD